MNDQLTLDLDRQSKIAEQFHIFHAQNPQVFEKLELLAGQMVARGRKHFGIGLLFEVLRWNFYMTTTDPSSDYKLNNNMRSHYARLLVEKHPDWSDIIATRELRSL